ncbi:MAG: hypothetical protein NTW04_01945 [Elusimicrobia bacterium]|nr:hypothetical protein [Elusimicrobiota bacterium]
MKTGFFMEETLFQQQMPITLFLNILSYRKSERVKQYGSGINRKEKGIIVAWTKSLTGY